MNFIGRGAAPPPGGQRSGRATTIGPPAPTAVRRLTYCLIYRGFTIL